MITYKVDKEYFDSSNKIWCMMEKEDNYHYYSNCHGIGIIVERLNGIIYLEENIDKCNLDKYINYINRCEQRKNTKIILLTLSPDTHRTSEENLGLAYLTAVLRRAGFFVEIIDAWLEGLNENEVYEKIINDEKIGIIGISCYMSNNDKSLALAQRIRKDNQYVKLICGGFGPSFNVEKFLQNKAFDYVMIGEGEKSIVQLCNYVLGYTNVCKKDIPGIAYLEDSEVIKNRKVELIENLDDLPFPARDTMHLAIEKKSTVNVLTARGCRGNCLFCSVNAFGKLSIGSKWRGRSVKNIVDELQLLYSQGVRYIKFIDDSFLEEERDEGWLENFRNEMINRNINVSLRGSIKADQVTDLRMKYLKEAGFHSFSCGIENGSPTSLARMNKSANIADNKNALRIMKKYNIYVQAGFILFDDNTTFSELKENYDFLREFDWIITKGIFSEMFAANGTIYTNILKKNNKIISSDIYDNNKYYINDNDVQMAYYALKKWHKSHMRLYDMVIDPISSPKAIPAQGELEFYQIYYEMKKKDLEFMCEIIQLIDDKIKFENLKKYVEQKINESKEFYYECDKEGSRLCTKYKMIYDVLENPFIT